MKKKPNKKFFDKEKMQVVALKTPYIFLLLLMIVISPLGAYLYYLRATNKKSNMYNKGRGLIGVGIFILFLIGVGIYSKVKEIMHLCGSGMSFDMINFLPDNVWLYIVGIVLIVSYIYSGKKLIERARVEQVYTYRINIDHQNSLKKISEELDVPVIVVKDNIKLLQRFGFLVPIDVDSKKNKIIYLDDKKTNDKHHDRKKKCSHCGALVTFKVDEYTECDFCGNGMIDDK